MPFSFESSKSCFSIKNHFSIVSDLIRKTKNCFRFEKYLKTQNLKIEKSRFKIDNYPFRQLIQTSLKINFLFQFKNYNEIYLIKSQLFVLLLNLLTFWQSIQSKTFYESTQLKQKPLEIWFSKLTKTLKVNDKLYLHSDHLNQIMWIKWLFIIDMLLNRSLFFK